MEISSRKAYHKLCTEFYDASKPEACAEEVNFYANAIKNAKGPILEAMCGSGRLLLPLLRLGFQIDGVDNSSEMLESCQKKCLSENIQVSLFDQSIERISLKNYALIYIPIGSFQLIHDRTKALEILRILHSHLLPEGTLIFDTFIPWDSIKASIAKDCLINEKITVSSDASIPCLDNTTIFLNSKTTIDTMEQLEFSRNTYEKRSGDKIIAKEDEELYVRWYYPYEMQLLLEKAGFNKVQMTKHTFKHNPNAIVYQAKV